MSTARLSASWVTVRGLGGRLALIDELHAALEVESETGRLGEQYEERGGDQPCH